jgi:lipoate synthase
MAAAPDVLAHNVEVVDRLQRKIRDPRCSFERSLSTLRGAKRLDGKVFTKSSLMLGLGETHEEVVESLERLRAAEVDFLTLGQYLRPTENHAPVREYVHPDRFLAPEARRATGLPIRRVRPVGALELQGRRVLRRPPRARAPEAVRELANKNARVL